MASNDTAMPVSATLTTTSDTNQALAILCQLTVVAGGSTKGNEELLAGLASVENSLRAVVDPVPSAVAPPLNVTPTVATCWSLNHPCYYTFGTVPSVVESLLRLPTALFNTTEVHGCMPVDLLTVDVLLPDHPSLPTSPTPPVSSLTLSTSPTRAPLISPIHMPLVSNHDELDELPRSATPTTDNAPTHIPPDSPLADRAHLDGPRKHTPKGHARAKVLILGTVSVVNLPPAPQVSAAGDAACRSKCANPLKSEGQASNALPTPSSSHAHNSSSVPPVPLPPSTSSFDLALAI
ncbi:hypothetical protein F5141DRAFT_1221211 [Pisolithus sp. B1]|nr:hypothetical protein F5141DRAFT_1221211 [Pisolithus sp. B1]